MEEPKFDVNALVESTNGQQLNPDVYSGSESINVLDINEYIFTEESLLGTNGFRTGEYLINHIRESFYDTRRQYSAYVNFIQPILRAMVEPVFTGEVNREYNKNELFDIFINDVNYNNLKLKDFVSMITKYVRLHSMTFLICDYILPKDEILTENDLIINNVHPYLYFKKPYHVEEYKLDFFGRLEEIVFVDELIKKEIEGKTKEIPSYIRWTKNTWERIYRGKNNAWLVEEIRNHNLGVLPISVIYENDRENTKNLFTHPNFYSLARINHQIYNQDSERRELQRNQAFSILVIQEMANSTKNKTLGSNNYLSISPEVTGFGAKFISPEVSILAELLNQRETAKNDLFSIADQIGVFGITKQAKSGIALSYEFSAYESTLRKTAQIANKIETEVARLWCLYTKTNNLNFVPHYNEEYKINKDENKITLYDTVNQMTLGSSTLNSLMAEDIARTLFPDEEEIVYDDIKNETMEQQIMDQEIEPKENTEII